MKYIVYAVFTALIAKTQSVPEPSLKTEVQKLLNLSIAGSRVCSCSCCTNPGTRQPKQTHCNDPS